MPRPNGALTRDTIVAAAGRSFARLGYHSASTAAIAAEAGVSEATLFKHFGTKQGLLVAALERARAAVRTSIDGTGRIADLDPVTAFGRLATSLLLDPLFAEITRLRAFALAQADDPEIRAALRRARGELREALGELFAGWQRRGILRTDVTAGHMADLALGLTYVAAWDLSIDAEDAPARIEALAKAAITLFQVASSEGATA